MINHERPQVDDIKRAAAGRWSDTIATVGGIDPQLLDGRHHPCPKCGGVDRFRLLDEADGAVYCNQCFSERNGDGIAAIQWLLECEFQEALQLIADHLSVSPADPVRPVKTEPATKSAANLNDAFDPISEGSQADLRAMFAASKPPITPEAVEAAGGVAVNWPKKFQGDGRCIAFPAVDDHGNVRGQILRRVNGEEFAPVGKLPKRKAHMVKGSRDGWIVPGGWDRVRRAQIVWKVEGLPDALALYSRLPADHAVVTNICGAKSVPPFLDPFKGKSVAIVPDADQAGVAGANRYAAKLGRVADEVRIAPLPYAVTEDHGRDLRDWLNDGGTLEALQAIADNAEAIVPGEVDLDDDGRPEIVLGTDEHRVIDQTVAALSADDSIYVRGGKLSTIIHGGIDTDGIARPETAARIVAIEAPTLRERITRHVRLLKMNEKEDLVPAHPPQWLTMGVSCRGYWPGLRNLAGIVKTPVLRPDGSVLSTPGYDATTGLFFDPTGLVVDVPDKPTRQEAQDAAAEILEVFCDFPFESECHQSSVLALIFSEFARPAFTGPVPLFVTEANVAGTGKGLLVDVVGLILTGDDLSRMSNPTNDEEARKRITSIAVRGDRIVLIDNIAGELGGAALDAALTATRWQDRILGGNEMVDLPLSVLWIATGNNVTLLADTSRRVCPIRMNCTEERPEERTGFVYSDLRGHVRANRAKLVRAALTALRGYFVAGQPQASLPGWGSFEGWTSVVRQAVVWLGMPDPAIGRIEMVARSDTQANALRQLLECWQEVDQWSEGLTTGDLMRKLTRERDNCPGVLEAILELCGGTIEKLPGVRAVGNKLRHVRGRVIGGRMLDGIKNRVGVQVWKVVGPSVVTAGSEGSTESVSAPATNFMF